MVCYQMKDLWQMHLNVIEENKKALEDVKN